MVQEYIFQLLINNIIYILLLMVFLDEDPLNISRLYGTFGQKK